MDLSDRIAAELPYLRRYARALTGSQEIGDEYALATLAKILEDRSLFDGDIGVRVALYKCFHTIWVSDEGGQGVRIERLDAKAQDHLATLTPNSREALLLSTVEEFDHTSVGMIMDIGIDAVIGLIDAAHSEMANSLGGHVMIIEDEPIIAADLKIMVEDLGHTVTGVARTHGQAVVLSKSVPPDLILSDIQLADNSSGIDAVNDILADLGKIPIIFITAFPERLLTGDRPEPAFLISKPYKEAQILSAVSQAMFFASTEPLRRKSVD